MFCSANYFVLLVFSAVIVFSETWLRKSVLDKDICIIGYNVYRPDRVKKGGGVAIYVKI